MSNSNTKNDRVPEDKLLMLLRSLFSEEAEILNVLATIDGLDKTKIPDVYDAEINKMLDRNESLGFKNLTLKFYKPATIKRLAEYYLSEGLVLEGVNCLEFSGISHNDIKDRLVKGARSAIGWYNFSDLVKVGEKYGIDFTKAITMSVNMAAEDYLSEISKGSLDDLLTKIDGLTRGLDTKKYDFNFDSAIKYLLRKGSSQNIASAVKIALKTEKRSMGVLLQLRDELYEKIRSYQFWLDETRFQDADKLYGAASDVFIATNFTDGIEKLIEFHVECGRSLSLWSLYKKLEKEPNREKVERSANVDFNKGRYSEAARVYSYLGREQEFERCIQHIVDESTDIGFEYRLLVAYGAPVDGKRLIEAGLSKGFANKQEKWEIYNTAIKMAESGVPISGAILKEIAEFDLGSNSDYYLAGRAFALCGGHNKVREIIEYELGELKLRKGIVEAVKEKDTKRVIEKFESLCNYEDEHKAKIKGQKVDKTTYNLAIEDYKNLNPKLKEANKIKSFEEWVVFMYDLHDLDSGRQFMMSSLYEPHHLARLIKDIDKLFEIQSFYLTSDLPEKASEVYRDIDAINPEKGKIALKNLAQYHRKRILEVFEKNPKEGLKLLLYTASSPQFKGHVTISYGIPSSGSISEVSLLRFESDVLFPLNIVAKLQKIDGVDNDYSTPPTEIENQIYQKVAELFREDPAVRVPSAIHAGKVSTASIGYGIGIAELVPGNNVGDILKKGEVPDEKKKKIIERVIEATNKVNQNLEGILKGISIQKTDGTQTTALEYWQKKSSEIMETSYREIKDNFGIDMTKGLFGAMDDYLLEKGKKVWVKDVNPTNWVYDSLTDILYIIDFNIILNESPVASRTFIVDFPCFPYGRESYYQKFVDAESTESPVSGYLTDIKIGLFGANILRRAGKTELSQHRFKRVIESAGKLEELSNGWVGLKRELIAAYEKFF